MKCFKCGRLTKNGGNLCWKCNHKWIIFMLRHPLVDYTSKAESNKRWNNFLNKGKEVVEFT